MVRDTDTLRSAASTRHLSMEKDKGKKRSPYTNRTLDLGTQQAQKMIRPRLELETFSELTGVRLT